MYIWTAAITLDYWSIILVFGKYSDSQPIRMLIVFVGFILIVKVWPMLRPGPPRNVCASRSEQDN